MDTEQGERSHTWPSIIRGRESVLFVISTGAPLTTWQLAVLDLRTGEVTRLGLAGISPHYVSTGHLVYAAEDNSLRAVPFDATSLAVTGNPVPLIEDVVVKASVAIRLPARFARRADGLGVVSAQSHQARYNQDDAERIAGSSP